MNLEELQARKQELEAAIISTTQSVYVLNGHKQEVDYQIGLLQQSDDGKTQEPIVE